MTLILAYIAIVAVCVAASVTDLRTGRIPNKLTASAMLAGLVFWLIAGLVAGRGLVSAEDDPQISGTLTASFLGLLSGLIPFAILVMLGGLGGGDMKLMGTIGAWGASWRIVLDTTIYALLAGAVIAIVLMVRTGRVRLTMARLIGIAASGGKAVTPDDDTSAPKVPFAVAALAGIAIAGAEHMLRLWPPLLG
ncbi:MAG: A24 family peptidase, partial [Planctomycetota bacterium]